MSVARLTLEADVVGRFNDARYTDSAESEVVTKLVITVSARALSVLGAKQPDVVCAANG